MIKHQNLRITLKSGDNVKIIKGKYKGKEGKIVGLHYIDPRAQLSMNDSDKVITFDKRTRELKMADPFISVSNLRKIEVKKTNKEVKTKKLKVVKNSEAEEKTRKTKEEVKTKESKGGTK